MDNRNLLQSFPRVGLTGVAFALLVGCAGNPVVTWKAPEPTGAADVGLARGHAYAAAARSAYQAAIAKQVNDQTTLSNGLYGTGALAAALALGQVHSSAIVGTTFLGGVGYGYGQLSHDRRRLLILQAGVEAINCANRAVAPFDTDIKALSGVLAQLVSAREAVTEARAAVNDALKGLAPADTERSPAEEDLNAADSVLEAASTAQKGAQAYLNAARRAGGELILAVDRIDASVVRATLDILPDLSAVPKVVAGLAGLAGQFVPAAGSEKLLREAVLAPLGAAMNAPKDITASVSKEVEELRAKRDALNKAVKVLAKAMSDLNIQMLGQGGALAPDALKDCGVTDVAFPLAVSADAVTFKLGIEATRSVLVSGGTKPYVVEVEGSPVVGLSVKGPAPFESRIVITATAALKAKGELSLLVMDSSSPTRNKLVTVKVDDGSAPAGVVATPPTNSTKKPTEVETLLKDTKFKLTRDGMTFTVKDVNSDASAVLITFACQGKPKSGKLPEVAAIKIAVLDKLGAESEGALGVKLNVKNDSQCIAAQ